jgi:hypothetical protein
MATGLIGTLAALVLGLLIASAKSTFDQETNQVRQMTANLILLDDLLAQYGPETASVRGLLRRSLQPLADRIWNEQEGPNSKPVRFKSSAESLAFEYELQHLSPTNDTQRSLQARAVQAFTEGAQIRLHVRTGGRFCSGPIFGHSRLLAQCNFRELHAICTNQSDRDDLPFCMRAVVCRRDISGPGARRPLHGVDGNFPAPHCGVHFHRLTKDEDRS